ncbi:hypothetical protein [Methylobacterium sp. R2-1]|nr:hypothetical protein [Methylobacterium sp. R2-1]MBB2962825.1 hypothetical protein [Methylobacterium sp. R2-1]
MLARSAWSKSICFWAATTFARALAGEAWRCSRVEVEDCDGWIEACAA